MNKIKVADKMKISIIGTGNIGGSIARHLVNAGHEVSVANSRGVDGVREFADEIGAQARDISGIVDGADIIIISVPITAVTKFPKDLFSNVPDSVPVVDTSNYYPGLRDPEIAEIEDGKPESVWVSEQINRRVIKAFNEIGAETLNNSRKPKGAPGRIASAIAGDDTFQKNRVMNLIDKSIGFDPVDSGTLDESWRQQPSSRIYACNWDVENMRKKLAESVHGEAREKLKDFVKMITEKGLPAYDEVIKMNRNLYD